MVFVDMITYILTTEGRNFITFLKVKYVVALDSCCMFIENRIEHDANSAYGICIH